MQLTLTSELVPNTCWYKNMRSEFPRSVWDKIRKKQYESQEYRCGICKCEAKGKLDCHEIWEFDDINRIQRLEGFIALCKLCHAVKHFGRIAMLDEKVRNQSGRAFYACERMRLEDF